MADSSPGMCPYHYCSDNPLNCIDPDGMQDEEAEPSAFTKFIRSLFWNSSENENRENNPKMSDDLNKTLMVANEAREIITDLGQEAVEQTVHSADAISDASTLGAVGGVTLTVIGAVTGQPELIAAGISLTKTSLAVGTTADGISLAVKTVDYVAFDGSGEKVVSQGTKFVFSAGAGSMTKPLHVVSRTGFATGPMFRSVNQGTRGQFITNMAGGFATAKVDAFRIALSNVSY
jgi:hypothetical protein